MLVDVGAIDGEAGDDFGERVPQAVEREVARSSVALGDALERVREHVQLARHRRLHDQPLAVVADIVERVDEAGHLRIGTTQPLQLAALDEHAVEIVEVAVPGCPSDGPASGKRFARREDLFCDDVEVAAAELLQHREVQCRIEEPVGMIDAHGLDAPALDQLFQERVRRGKHLRVFDPQAGQLIHVEESAVVDLVRRRAPVRQAVGLRLEELVQDVEALRTSDLAIDLAHRRGNAFAHGRTLGHEPRQPRAGHFFFPLTFVDEFDERHRFTVPVLGVQVGKVLQRGQDAEELVELRAVSAEHCREWSDGAPKDERRELRIDRQFVVAAVAKNERAVFERQRKLAALEHAAVLIAEDRQQQLGVERGLDR